MLDVLKQAIISPWVDTWHIRRRVTRLPYWIGIVFYGILGWLFTHLGTVLLKHTGVIGMILLVVGLVIMYMTIMLTVHRFRDVGITGWIILGFMFLNMICYLLGIFGKILMILIDGFQVFLLLGDSGVMPEGVWSPEYDKDK